MAASVGMMSLPSICAVGNDSALRAQFSGSHTQWDALHSIVHRRKVMGKLGHGSLVLCTGQVAMLERM
jgi:hypothetical protein